MLRKVVRPDSKGRITLGVLAKGVSSFSITKTSDNRLILEPYAEIPAYEKWLFDNRLALEKVTQGIKEAASNNVSERESFAKYADEEID